MPGPTTRWLAVLGAVAAAVAWSAGEAASQVCERPCVGPARGAILAAGGGRLGDQIYEEFVQLAGGADARIVLIPTASDGQGSQDGWTASEELRRAGATHVEILHTRTRAVADLEVFAAPVREATGVWFSGGHQQKLVEVYLDTRTHRELNALLERGGVIGGNSAGASALASFLLRGASDNTVVLDPEHDVGFGFLRGVAIDQHLLARARENDLLTVLDAHPNLLGIGLNEGSAVLITGDLTRVMGESVAIYDVTDPLTLIPLRWLRPGDVYDLGARRLIRDDADEPPIPPPFNE
jgi:cyanophycinase